MMILNIFSRTTQMHRVEKGRKSAKGVIEAYANELMNRTNDHNKAEKLAVIETIALRMGWTKLYERLMNYRRENNQNLH
jgi:hypothetical protein